MSTMHRLLLGLTNGIMAASRTSIRDVCGPYHADVGMAYLGGENAILSSHEVQA